MHKIGNCVQKIGLKSPLNNTKSGIILSDKSPAPIRIASISEFVLEESLDQNAKDSRIQ